jgi:hypothetical protein
MLEYLVMERFWSKVSKSDGCWEWTGARFQRERTRALSYGMFLLNRRLQPAHRVAWEMINGPIPDGLWVLHHCDNQGCVRPEHLYLGTHADNTRDAIERHRMVSGEQVPGHKLTVEELPQIRRLIAEGMATEDIGRIFGVSGRTIRYIRSGEHWKYD